MPALAGHYGVSRARIGQILRDLGISLYDGGRFVQARRREAERLAAREAECLMGYGVDLATRAQINKMLTGKNNYASYLYRQHRFQRLKRDFIYRLTFAQWAKIWKESGKYVHGGCGSGEYVLTLKPRCKIYQIGSVEVRLYTDMMEKARNKARAKK